MIIGVVTLEGEPIITISVGGRSWSAVIDTGFNGDVKLPIDLFDQRPDKEWSLTDCISFVVMHKERITEALTGDKHFEQAGRVAGL